MTNEYSSKTEEILKAFESKRLEISRSMKAKKVNVQNSFIQSERVRSEALKQLTDLITQAQIDEYEWIAENAPYDDFTLWETRIRNRLAELQSTLKKEQ